MRQLRLFLPNFLSLCVGSSMMFRTSPAWGARSTDPLLKCIKCNHIWNVGTVTFTSWWKGRIRLFCGHCQPTKAVSKTGSHRIIVDYYFCRYFITIHHMGRGQHSRANTQLVQYCIQLLKGTPFIKMCWISRKFILFECKIWSTSDNNFPGIVTSCHIIDRFISLIPNWETPQLFFTFFFK